MDYLTYWGLYRKPFAQDDNGYYFSGMPQREAAAGLSYFITSSLNSACLVAPSGCGMTRLFNHIRRMNGFGDCAAEVIMTVGTYCTAEEAIGELAAALGISAQAAPAYEQTARALQSSTQRGIRTVWLIDRCHSATAKLARDLVMTSGDLSVVMGVSPGERAKLSAIFGRCCMQVDLDRLELCDTIRYVGSALEHAGARGPLFLDSAIVRMHEIAQGHVADLAGLAETALLLAAGRQLTEIPASLVEVTAQQLAKAA